MAALPKRETPNRLASRAGVAFLRRLRLAIWFFLLAAATFVMAQKSVPPSATTPVLFVNDAPIGVDEFIWFMQQERPAVFRLVKTKFNLTDGTNFWSHPIGGETPRALLQDRTVKRIVREKIPQLLFRELGVVDQINYTNFLANLEKLNRDRAVAVQSGGTVYGPVFYSQLQYYDHWMSSLEILAKEHLAETEWNVTEAKVRAFYDQNPAAFRREDPAITNITPPSRTLSFEEAKTRAREEYVNSLYGQLISNRIAHAQVRLNQAAMTAFLP